MRNTITATVTALSLIAVTVHAQQQAPAPAAPTGALAPANLAKPRPKAPFDVTGVWLHGGGPNNSFRFSPPAGFKLTPAAQVHYDAARKAQAEGKVYRDDIGQCWLRACNDHGRACGNREMRSDWIYWSASS